MSNNKADGSYLAPLAEPAPHAEGPASRDWYERTSRGLDELEREGKQQRDLMALLLGEPERQLQQVVLLLMPSPSQETH